MLLSGRHSRLEPKSFLLNTHGELMRKKRDKNEETKTVAKPVGTVSERDGEQVEFEIALDPGSDLDPEGWMAERSGYWAELAQPESIGGGASWVATIRSILARLNPLPSARRRNRLEQATELTHEDWTRLSESALGKLHPVPRDDGLPVASFGRNALPKTWKAGELMASSITGASATSSPSVEEHAKAQPAPEGESEVKPAAAAARATRRRP